MADPSDTPSSDSLRNLAADLSAHPEVLSDRERQLLASIVAQLNAQTRDPNVGTALQTALSNTLGPRASTVLGAAVASHLLTPTAAVPAVAQRVPTGPVAVQPGFFGPIVPAVPVAPIIPAPVSPAGPIATDPTDPNGPYVWPPLHPPPLFPPVLPPLPPPMPGPVPIPIPIPPPVPDPPPGVPPMYPFPTPPSLPPDDPFFPHGPAPIFPPIPLGDPPPAPVDPIDPGPILPIDPGPIDPGPVDPGPVDPGPVDPGPIDPGPVDPGPIDPGPVDPGPVDPGPVGPSDPGPVSPGPVDPGPVSPDPTPTPSPSPDPGPSDPGPSDPGPSDPPPGPPDSSWNSLIDVSAIDSLIDQFASLAQLVQVAQVATAASAGFETHIQVARSIDGQGEAQRVQVQVLGQTDAIAKLIAPNIQRLMPAAARRLAPGARRVSGIRLSVVTLQPGATMRLDFASEPAHAGDVLLTAVFSTTGKARAGLSLLRGPLRLAGVDPQRGQVSIPLFEGRAVVTPALRPTALTIARGAARTFVMTALCTLSAK